MPNFYCQKKSGIPDFSIEEWNKAQEEYKTLTPLQQQYFDELDESGTICKHQCEACERIVLKTQANNKVIREQQKIKPKNKLMEKPEAVALFKEYCALPENAEKRERSAKYQDNRLIWDITGPKYGFRINNAGASAKMFVFVMWTGTNDPHQSTIDLTQEEFNDLLAAYIGNFKQK